AAARPVRRPGRARAGAAGALLAPRLGAAAGDEPSALRPPRTGALRVQLGAHGLVNEMGLHLDSEHLAVKRHLLGRLAGGIEEWGLDRARHGGGGAYAPSPPGSRRCRSST